MGRCGAPGNLLQYSVVLGIRRLDTGSAFENVRLDASLTMGHL